MVLFSKRLNSMVAAVFGLALCAHGAQAPQHVNINQFSTTVEDVVVPLPNELFGALNKLGAVNWKEHVRSDDRTAMIAHCQLKDPCRPARPGTGQGDRRKEIQSRHTPRRSSMRQTSAIGQMCGRNWIALKTAFNRQ